MNLNSIQRACDTFFKPKWSGWKPINQKPMNNLKPCAKIFIDEDGTLCNIPKVRKLLEKVREAKLTTSEAKKFKYFLHDYITNPYNE